MTTTWRLTVLFRDRPDEEPEPAGIGNSGYTAQDLALRTLVRHGLVGPNSRWSLDFTQLDVDAAWPEPGLTAVTHSLLTNSVYSRVRGVFVYEVEVE